MNQQKTGEFLRELRQEKGLTQEQLAEEFRTTNRSISRWENGWSMPDISVLVELADFYGVDVRELIDGERRSEEIQDTTRDAVLKIADYTETERGRLLQLIRRIATIGVVLMTAELVLQTIWYEPDTGGGVLYLLSVLVFVIMVVLSLYANGLLEHLVKIRKMYVALCRAAVTGMCILVGVCTLRVLLVFAMVFAVESRPAKKISDIENYNKSYYIEEYGGDIDSGLFLFPDDTARMIEPTFESSMDTGLFDSDGYIILHAGYSREDYQNEVERLLAVTCTIFHNDEEITQRVKYDEKSYRLPAVVAVDGFDYSYEYALLNEEEHTITYIYLSYPKPVELVRYKEYLKKGAFAYDVSDALNQFSIYSYSFDGGESWIDYSD